jgi:hypothetical protein
LRDQNAERPPKKAAAPLNRPGRSPSTLLPAEEKNARLKGGRYEGKGEENL